VSAPVEAHDWRFRRRQNSIKFQTAWRHARARFRSYWLRSGVALWGCHNWARLLWVSIRFESEWRQNWLQSGQFRVFLPLSTAL